MGAGDARWDDFGVRVRPGWDPRGASRCGGDAGRGAAEPTCRRAAVIILVAPGGRVPPIRRNAGLAVLSATAIRHTHRRSGDCRGDTALARAVCDECRRPGPHEQLGQPPPARSHVPPRVRTGHERGGARAEPTPEYVSGARPEYAAFTSARGQRDRPGAPPIGGLAHFQRGAREPPRAGA